MRVIFRSKLKSLLQYNEKLICDSGYPDERFVTPSGRHNFVSSVHNWLKARHESLNRRFKSFMVLSKKFRHNLELYSMCFFAVANVVQLSLLEMPLFDIPANDSS